MAPVVLQTDVHCFTCARRIRKCINNLFGVERVWASPETGLVVVAGTADATVLRRRIQRKMRRYVTIVSDGAVPWEMAQYAGMTHLAPPPNGWGMAPSQHPYSQQPAGYYPYIGNHWESEPYDYVSNATPTCSIL